jgi:hypothetical protein
MSGWDDRIETEIGVALFSSADAATVRMLRLCGDLWRSGAMTPERAAKLIHALRGLDSKIGRAFRGLGGKVPSADELASWPVQA